MKFEKIKQRILSQQPQRFIASQLKKEVFETIIEKKDLKQFIKYDVFILNTLFSSEPIDKSDYTLVDSWRSIGDLYNLTRNYFPECSLEQFIIIFFEDLVEGNDTNLVGHFCSDIQKRVYKINKYEVNGREYIHQYILTDWHDNDEYNMDIDDWIDLAEQLKNENIT